MRCRGRGDRWPVIGVDDDLLRQYCETENGVPVNGHDIIRAAMAGYIRRVVINGEGTITDFGRKRRLFNGAAREALKLMIDGCEHIGCPVRRRVVRSIISKSGSATVAPPTFAMVRSSATDRTGASIGWASPKNARPSGKVVQYRADGTADYPGRATASTTDDETEPKSTPHRTALRSRPRTITSVTRRVDRRRLANHPSPPRRLTAARRRDRTSSRAGPATGSLTGRVDVPDQPRDARHPAARERSLASIHQPCSPRSSKRPATARSSRRCSRTSACSPASVTPPTWSARRCTTSSTRANVTSRCAPR